MPNRLSWRTEPETMKPSTEPKPAPKLKLPVGFSTTSTDIETRCGWSAGLAEMSTSSK